MADETNDGANAANGGAPAYAYAHQVKQDRIRVLRQKAGDPPGPTEVVAEAGIDEIVELGPLGLLLWTMVFQLADLSTQMRQINQRAEAMRQEGGQDAMAQAMAQIERVAPGALDQLRRNLRRGA